jgi:hypothetical protein
MVRLVLVIYTSKEARKKVLLLIDNYSSHVKAVEDLKEENSIILYYIECDSTYKMRE